MSMRSQVYEWDASRGTAMTTATSIGQRISIFVGGVGNNITKPAETTATEFVVIEDSMSEDLLPYLRLRHLGAADAFLLEAIFRQARPVPTIALGDTTGPARHSAAHNIALSAR